MQAMRSAFTSSVLTFCLIGCGQATKCEEATHKIVSECKLGEGYSLGGPIQECNDQVECEAECVLDASCSELTDPMPPPNAEYQVCRGVCAMLFQPPPPMP